MREWISETATVLAMSAVSAARMWRSARKWKWADLQTLETWCLKYRLLSRVAPRVTMQSERGMIDPAMATSDTGGKLRMRLDVPSRIDSDLLRFKASPLWQSQECSECRQDSRTLSWTVRSSVDTEMCNWVSSCSAMTSSDWFLCRDVTRRGLVVMHV